MEIKIENLTKKFGVQRAVDSISFDVKPGDILGFLGPNGAGKTTAMKMITGFMLQDEGTINIAGKSMIEHADYLKKEIGYLPENNPLYLDMNVIDYLVYCAELQGIAKDNIMPRVREMIRICGINAEKHKNISELSKGYRQRVGLAQAMIHDPEILILDEPTTGLDPNQIVEIRKLIKELGREKTVILSTHILPEVEATCDRILIINNGKIVADGTSKTLRAQAQSSDIIRVRIEDGKKNEIFNSLKELASISFVDLVDNQDDMFEVQGKPDTPTQRDIFNLCVNKKWVITEMLLIETKLEDVFRNLTTQVNTK